MQGITYVFTDLFSMFLLIIFWQGCFISILLLLPDHLECGNDLCRLQSHLGIDPRIFNHCSSEEYHDRIYHHRWIGLSRISRCLQSCRNCWNHIWIEFYGDFSCRGLHGRWENHDAIRLDMLFFRQNSKEYHGRAFYCSASLRSTFHLHCSERFRIHFWDHRICLLHTILLPIFILYSLSMSCQMERESWQQLKVIVLIWCFCMMKALCILQLTIWSVRVVMVMWKVLSFCCG